MHNADTALAGRYMHEDYSVTPPIAARAIEGTNHADQLSGTALADAIYGEDGDDILVGHFGSDSLYGGSGGDRLSGGKGNDWLDGGSGNDTLTGDTGQDHLTGGAGADTFLFNLSDMAVTKGKADDIVDFSHADGDKIDLHNIDAITGGHGDAFKWIGDKAFTGHAGELHYSFSGGDTYVSGDINGDGHADFFIKLDGHVELVKGDFVL